MLLSFHLLKKWEIHMPRMIGWNSFSIRGFSKVLNLRKRVMWRLAAVDPLLLIVAENRFRVLRLM